MSISNNIFLKIKKFNCFMIFNCKQYFANSMMQNNILKLLSNIPLLYSRCKIFFSSFSSSFCKKLPSVASYSHLMAPKWKTFLFSLIFCFSQYFATLAALVLPMPKVFAIYKFIPKYELILLRWKINIMYSYYEFIIF